MTSNKREDRFFHVALTVANALVVNAVAQHGESQGVEFEPPLATIAWHEGNFYIVNDETMIAETVPPNDAAEYLAAVWLGSWQEHRDSRSAMERAMREKGRQLGVLQRGGSRPAERPDDGRKSNRVGTPIPGRLANRFVLSPFSAGKGEGFSIATLTLTRCNTCGALFITPYTEWANGTSYSHPGQPIQHKDDCPMNGA